MRAKRAQNAKTPGLKNWQAAEETSNITMINHTSTTRVFEEEKSEQHDLPKFGLNPV